MYRNTITLAMLSALTVPAAAWADAEQLPLLEVEEAAADPYRRSDLSLGERLELPLLSIPQGVQVLGEDLLRDRGVVQMADALRMVPSANVGQTRLAPFSSFSWTIRGFDAGVTRNGFRQLYFEDVDQSGFMNVERIEILKGPGSSLLGQEGLGGTINILTKRPQRRFGGELRGTFGEHDTRIGGFDITGPLTAGGALSARLNAEVERSGSFVDFQDLDRSNVAASLAWDDGGPLRGLVSFEYMERQSLPHPGLPVVGTVLDNGADRVSRSTYLGEPALDFLDTDAPLVQAWLEWDLGGEWTLSPRFQYYKFNVHQQQARLLAVQADGVTVNRRGRFDFHENDDEYTVQLELRGQPRTGPLEHRLLLGVEHARFDDIGRWNNFALPGIDSLDPVYLTGLPPVGPLITFGVDIRTWAVYAQDLVTVAPWLELMGGFRFTDYRMDSEFLGDTARQSDSDLSFNVGAALKPREGLSFFAGYASGFDLENVIGSFARDGTPFQPELSRQWEAGFKVDLARGLSGTLSFFRLSRENVTTTDPVDPNFAVQVGEQRTKGVELELAWRPDDNWYLQGGYAYIDSEISRSNDGDQGNRVQNVARHQASAWLRYLFTQGSVRGLALGAGGSHVGRRAGDNANSFDLPAYSLMDLSASYQWRWLRAELLAHNVLDEVYFTHRNNFVVYPGEPRQILGRLIVEF